MQSQFDAVPARVVYVLIVAIAVVFTFFVHESAHWAAGELLGNDMQMTLNNARPISRQYVEAWHLPWVAAAGPLVTLLQAILLASIILLWHRSPMLYPFLLSAVIMRLLATGVSVIMKPQDEARVSLALGLGSFTVPAVMSALLIALAFFVSRRQSYSTRFNVVSVLLIVTFSSVLILA